jgi:hypothetical protein
MESRSIDHGYVPPPPETHQHFLIVSLPMGFMYASAVAWTSQLRALGEVPDVVPGLPGGRERAPVGMAAAWWGYRGG